jgi:DNA-binding Lrp family transcriptional regulator
MKRIQASKTSPELIIGVVKMPNAFVLLNTEIGAESQVLLAIKKIEGVEEAHNLWGVYDIIANIRADSMDELRFIVTTRIGKIAKINSKLTMLMLDQTQPILQEQVILEESPVLL